MECSALKDPQSLIGVSVNDRYEVIEILGKGGGGCVFKARDNVEKRDVALKFLVQSIGQGEAENLISFARFSREAQLQCSLRHPNIIEVFEHGTFQGQPYIVMELVLGESLHSTLLRNKFEPIPFDTALTYFEQLVSAMSHAHEKGIIHRDLKPSNIMISETGIVKVGDFGIAKQQTSTDDLTRTTDVLGTMEFMAPEQLESRPKNEKGERQSLVDTRTDVYLLAIVGHLLVSGRHPFHYSDDMTTPQQVTYAFRHMNEPIPQLAVPGSKVPDWFGKIIQKAGAKDKSQRYKNASQLEKALKRQVSIIGQVNQISRHPIARSSFYGLAILCIATFIFLMFQ